MPRGFSLCFFLVRQYQSSFLSLPGPPIGKCLFRVALILQAGSSEAGEEEIMEASGERREWEQGIEVCMSFRTSHRPLGALQFPIYFPLPSGAESFCWYILNVLHIDTLQ